MQASLKSGDRPDDELLATAKASLQLLKATRDSIVLVIDDVERRLAQMFFVGKIYLVTNAIVTLIEYGQGKEAENRLREQYEFIIALLYYHKNQRNAALS